MRNLDPSGRDGGKDRSAPRSLIFTAIYTYMYTYRLYDVYCMFMYGAYYYQLGQCDQVSESTQTVADTWLAV